VCNYLDGFEINQETCHYDFVQTITIVDENDNIEYTIYRNFFMLFEDGVCEDYPDCKFIWIEFSEYSIPELNPGGAQLYLRYFDENLGAWTTDNYLEEDRYLMAKSCEKALKVLVLRNNIPVCIWPNI